MWNKKITLKNESDGIDAEGQPVVDASGKTVFAKKKSVKRAEFYMAGTDLKPSIVFEIYTHEYSEEEIVVYGNVNYRVIRTYAEEDSDTIELVCEKL